MPESCASSEVSLVPELLGVEPLGPTEGGWSELCIQRRLVKRLSAPGTAVKISAQMGESEPSMASRSAILIQWNYRVYGMDAELCFRQDTRLHQIGSPDLGTSAMSHRCSQRVGVPAAPIREGTMSEAKQWRDLYHLASVERDPAKLEILYEEIRRLLDQCDGAEGKNGSKYSLPSRLQN